MTLIIKKNDKDERLNLRVTPKIKYMLELMVRSSNKTASSLIIDGIQAISKNQTYGIQRKVDGRDVNVAQQSWDPLEIDRLVKLAKIAPDLLTDWETLLWKAIQEDEKYHNENAILNLKLIRDDWHKIQKKAAKFSEL